MHQETNLRDPDFTVGDIDIVTVIRGESYRHSHRNGRLKHGFIYVVRGSMEDELLTDPIKTIRLEAGQFLFVPAGTAYESIYREEDTCIRIVQFTLKSGQLPQYLRQPVLVELPDSGKLMDRFFEPAGGEGFYHLSCLYSLLGQVCAALTKPAAKYRRLQPALEHMRVFCRENQKIDFYAELCGMSEVNFRRLFRAYTGSSPVDYRNDLRLQRARGLLLSGEYTVSETAELCGFSNLSFFIRLYKQKFGHTPKKE